jgi:hypothetical protein
MICLKWSTGCLVVGNGLLKWSPGCLAVGNAFGLTGLLNVWLWVMVWFKWSPGCLVVGNGLFTVVLDVWLSLSMLKRGA